MVSRIALLVVLLLLSAPGTADDSRKATRLVFTAIDDVPGTHLASRLLEEAYARLGIDMDTLTVPSRRALLFSDAGEVDGELFRIEGIGRDFHNLIQVPYPLLQARLWAVAGSAQWTGSPGENPRPQRIVVRRGVIIAERTARRLGGYLLKADSFEQIRAMLERGRADVALVSDIEGLSPLTDPAWQRLYRLPEPLARFPLYHYLHRRHVNLVEPLATQLRLLDESGEKQRLIEQFRSGY